MGGDEQFIGLRIPTVVQASSPSLSYPSYGMAFAIRPCPTQHRSRVAARERINQCLHQAGLRLLNTEAAGVGPTSSLQLYGARLRFPPTASDGRRRQSRRSGYQRLSATLGRTGLDCCIFLCHYRSEFEATSHSATGSQTILGACPKTGRSTATAILGQARSCSIVFRRFSK